MANEENNDQKTPVQAASAPAYIAPVPILTYQLPRNPCIFSGENQQDASRWLKDYERIAAYNHWDEQMQLANVVFYLDNTARQWFDNNEDTFTDWTVFQNSLKNTFGRTEDISRQAERLLLTRAQHPGETSESYIQDVLALCRKAKPSMPEDEKVAHLLKGIAEDLHQILVFHDYKTVDELVKRCREIESIRRRRISRPKFQRLPNVATVSADTDCDDIRSLIRTIVREELRKVLPELQGNNEEPESELNVASMVREEVLEALAPLTARTTHSNSLAPLTIRRNAPSRRSFPMRPQPRRVVTDNTGPQRRTDLWRTADNVPLCYHCGRPGHVLRYCRERRRVFADARAARTFNTQRDEDAESLQGFDDNYAQPTPSRFRNSSPYPRRSFSRRQSPSPLRRSSRSPHRSSEGN